MRLITVIVLLRTVFAGHTISQSVEALSDPPCFFMKASNAFSSGYFSLPMKTTKTNFKIRIMFTLFKISQYKNSHQSHYCWIHRIRKTSSKRLLRDQNLTPQNNKIILINNEKDKTTKKRRSYLPMGVVIIKNKEWVFLKSTLFAMSSSERTTKGCKGCTCPYMACHATHTVTGGPPLNLFRIKISDNENDDATAADATAADDEDDDCDNDYTHSINNYWQRKHWTLTVLQEVGQSWHVIWIRKTTSTNAKSCSRLRRWGNKILLFKIKLLISQKTMTLRLVLLTSFFNLATSVSVLLFCNWQLYVYVSSVCISIYHIKLYVIDSYNYMQRRSCLIA